MVNTGNNNDVYCIAPCVDWRLRWISAELDDSETTLEQKKANIKKLFSNTGPDSSYNKVLEIAEALFPTGNKTRKVDTVVTNDAGAIISNLAPSINYIKNELGRNPIKAILIHHNSCGAADAIANLVVSEDKNNPIYEYLEVERFVKEIGLEEFKKLAPAERQAKIEEMNAKFQIEDAEKTFGKGNVLFLKINVNDLNLPKVPEVRLAVEGKPTVNGYKANFVSADEVEGRKYSFIETNTKDEELIEPALHIQPLPVNKGKVNKQSKDGMKG